VSSSSTRFLRTMGKRRKRERKPRLEKREESE
jgi:hypothetical protein